MARTKCEVCGAELSTKEQKALHARLGKPKKKYAVGKYNFGEITAVRYQVGTHLVQYFILPKKVKCWGGWQPEYLVTDFIRDTVSSAA